MEAELYWLRKYISLLEKYEEHSVHLRLLYPKVSTICTRMNIPENSSFVVLIEELKGFISTLSSLCSQETNIQVPWRTEWKKQIEVCKEWETLLFSHKENWLAYQRCREAMQEIEKNRKSLWETAPSLIHEHLDVQAELVEFQQLLFRIEMEQEEDNDEDNPTEYEFLAQKMRLEARYRYIGLEVPITLSATSQSIHKEQEDLDFHVSWLHRLPKMLQEYSHEELRDLDIPTLPYTEKNIHHFVAQLRQRTKKSRIFSQLFQKRYQLSPELEDMHIIAQRIEGGQPFIEMQCIDPGTYRIGERTQNKIVTQEHSFWIGMFPVTEGLYHYVHSNGKALSSEMPQRDISWFQALHFCNLLSKYDGLIPCYQLAAQPGLVVWNMQADGYRLPTGLEWEIAAQAGLSNLSEHKKSQRVWSKENAKTPQPVGRKRPNQHCLYDMLGNVWEWCWDRHPDQQCMIRGGSFLCSARDMDVSIAELRPALHQSFDIGFRLVRNKTIHRDT